MLIIDVICLQDTKVHRQIPLSNILDAIEFEPVEPIGTDDSDSDEAREMARSPTSPRKPRHLHLDRDRERTRTRTSGKGEKGTVVQHAFQVITPQRTFKLCAPSEEEEIKWVAALRALINRERGLMSPTMMTGTMASGLPAMSASASGLPGGGQGQSHAYVQGAQAYVHTGQASRTHSQAPTPSVQPGSEENSYFTLGNPVAINPNNGSNNMTSVPGTPGGGSAGGFTYPIPQQQPQPPQSGRTTRASLPPLVTTPSHTRTRSATQSAKAAVAEVVRRFNPESSTG